MSKEFGEIRSPERKGVMFLIYKDGKFLIENRTNPDKTYYGYSIIPGGKVDKDGGETFEDAVSRELLEECGITNVKMILLDTFLHVTMSNQLYRTSACLITEFEGEVENKEGKSEQVWVDIDKAQDRLPFADSKYVITLAKDYIKHTLGDN